IRVCASSRSVISSGSPSPSHFITSTRLSMSRSRGASSWFHGRRTSRSVSRVCCTLRIIRRGIAVATVMRVEIWSDVVCPWCYIGKRRLEKALADFPHADDVEVVWRSFQLDPSAPDVPVETVAEYLGRKYGGGPEAGRQMVDRTQAIAAEEGMTWRQHE